MRCDLLGSRDLSLLFISNIVFPQRHVHPPVELHLRSVRSRVLDVSKQGAAVPPADGLTLRPTCADDGTDGEGCHRTTQQLGCRQWSRHELKPLLGQDTQGRQGRQEDDGGQERWHGGPGGERVAQEESVVVQEGSVLVQERSVVVRGTADHRLTEAGD